MAVVPIAQHLARSHAQIDAASLRNHELALNETSISAASLPRDGLPSVARLWRIVRPSYLQPRRAQALGAHLHQAFRRIC